MTQIHPVPPPREDEQDIAFERVANLLQTGTSDGLQ